MLLILDRSRLEDILFGKILSVLLFWFADLNVSFRGESFIKVHSLDTLGLRVVPEHSLSSSLFDLKFIYVIFLRYLVAAASAHSNLSFKRHSSVVFQTFVIETPLVCILLVVVPSASIQLLIASFASAFSLNIPLAQLLLVILPPALFII